MKKNETQSFCRRKLNKPLLAMKMTLMLIVAGVLQVSASVYSQNTRLNLSLNDLSLVEVFKEIRNNSEFTFVYDLEDVEDVKQLSIEHQDATVEEVLDACLEGTNLTYEIVDEVVIVKQKPHKPFETPVKQEKKTITGEVKDKQGLPLPGVSVVIKGTFDGTVTDANGAYSIVVYNKNTVLVFSFVGMEAQEIQVGDQTNIHVTLEEDTSELDEVVVTGYQEVKKERMTGSVEVIGIEDIIDKPYASVDQLLAGKVAGMSTFMASGQAGQTAEINIRGINSISGSSTPLWIIDGLPLQGESPDISGGEASLLTNGIGNIPASDIKSITVLKDAAATSIYGAKAANGVIVVTTKSGSEGDMYVSFDGSVSISDGPNLDLGFMNTAEKIEYEKGLFEDYYGTPLVLRQNGGTVYRALYDMNGGQISRDEKNSIIDNLSKTNTDWFDEIFSASISKSYGLNISGGSKKIQYYASINRKEEDGILRSDSYDNTAIRTKGTFQPNDKFKLVLGVNTTMRGKDYHNSSVDPFKYAVYANPYEKPYNDDGTYAYDNTYLNFIPKQGLSDEPTYGTFNILSELKNTKRNEKYTSTSMYANLSYKIIDGLKLSTKFVTTKTQKDVVRLAHPGTYGSYQQSFFRSIISRDLTEEENRGYYSEVAQFTNEYSFNNTLEFSKEYDELYVNALIGQEISAVESNSSSAWFPEYYPEYDMVGYPEISGIDATVVNLSKFVDKSNSEARYSSFFSSVTVGYADRYILNFNARYDGADLIGEAERFTPLWSVSGRWNLHKEGFMKNVSFLNALHIKGEYGFTGNINRSAYPFTTITLSEANRYNGALIADSYTYPNPGIKWEKKEEKSISLGASMFNSRFNFVFNYYHNTVTDLLNSQKLPISSGVFSLIANVSDLLNEGYELSLKYTAIKNKNFSLKFDFNGAYNTDEVSNAFYDSLDDVKLAALITDNPSVSGQGVQAVYGLIDKGVNVTTGQRMVEGKRLQEDGTYALETVARTSVSISNDVTRGVNLGQLNPTFHGGFGFSASYKNWDLSTHFKYEAGHIIPKFAERLSSPAGSNPLHYSRLNVLKNKMNRWRRAGDITDIESYSDNVSSSVPLDTDYEKGDYIKMKSLILAYRIPVAKLKKANIGIKRVRMSLQADNLLTFTNYSGIDPETRNNFGYPIATSYRFALNFGF